MEVETLNLNGDPNHGSINADEKKELCSSSIDPQSNIEHAWTTFFPTRSLPQWFTLSITSLRSIGTYFEVICEMPNIEFKTQGKTYVVECAYYDCSDADPYFYFLFYLPSSNTYIFEDNSLSFLNRGALDDFVGSVMLADEHTALLNEVNELTDDWVASMFHECVFCGDMLSTTTRINYCNQCNNCFAHELCLKQWIQSTKTIRELKCPQCRVDISNTPSHSWSQLSSLYFPSAPNIADCELRPPSSKQV